MAWETPVGTVNGTTGFDGNPTFTTAGIISGETLCVGRFVQIPGTDYTTSGVTITFLAGSIPVTGDAVRIQYTALPISTASASTTFDYSASGILNRIRDIAYAGNSIRDWDDTKLLRLVNAEIQEYLVPFIMTARKNHFDTSSDVALVANQRTYYLPSAATAMKIRAIVLVDAAGSPYAKLQERELEDVISMGLPGALQLGTPQVYAFQGNQILLYPPPSGSPALSLRYHYIRRPSTVVANSAAIAATGFPGGAATGFFRVGFSGTAPAGIAGGASVDLVLHNPGFDLLGTYTVNAVSAGVYVELGGTIPTNISIGDWLCVSGTAPVVTGAIPEMTIGCLVKKCVLEIMSGKSDDAAFNRTAKLLSLDEKRAHQFLNRRNTGDRPKAGIGSLYKFKGGRAWLG